MVYYTAAGVVRAARDTQAAFAVLAALQLTAHVWPPQANVTEGASYDYVVVGAGTAGCVVAARLAELPAARVLLVEAGCECFLSFFQNSNT